MFPWKYPSTITLKVKTKVATKDRTNGKVSLVSLTIKKGGPGPPVYHRALPLGNTSSGKIKFSCG